MNSPISFSILEKIPNALGRAGVLKTQNGEIKTPAFVAVGTKATVKALTPEIIQKTKTQVVLGNTYHLFLQPGDEILKKAGGIGKFMNWQGPTMTDSGGYQVFSLGTGFGKKIGKISPEEKTSEAGLLLFDEDALSPHLKLAKIDDDGVTFTSHLDGSLHRFTPERSVEIQHNLVADMFFAFDECTSPDDDFDYQKKAMERTHNWAERSLKAHRQNLEACRKQAIFGIVQGGRYQNLREESAEFISSLDFDGFGIGGSFAKKDMNEAVLWVNKILPEEKPKHLLGIGEPEDLLMGIENGIDLLDCVAPTRLGRNGTIYTKKGKINLMNEKYKNDFSSFSEFLPEYSFAYISHLFRADEMLGATLASAHNLYFISDLVEGARQAIISGNFLEYKRNFLKEYNNE